MCGGSWSDALGLRELEIPSFRVMGFRVFANHFVAVEGIWSEDFKGKVENFRVLRFHGICECCDEVRAAQ